MLASQTRLEAKIEDYRKLLLQAEIKQKHQMLRELDNRRKVFTNEEEGNLRVAKAGKHQQPKPQPWPQLEQQQKVPVVKQQE